MVTMNRDGPSPVAKAELGRRSLRAQDGETHFGTSFNEESGPCVE